MKSGIVAYGAALPYRRIAMKTILDVWGNSSQEILEQHLKLSERAVLFFDEDTNTLAIDAARNALAQGGLPGKDLEAVYLGTGTNPWASNPSSTVIAEAVGAGSELICCDLQFSGKSGTAAMQALLGLTESGLIKTGLAIGADTLNRHVSPGELYEYAASAGAAAFVIGTESVVATVLGMHSHVSSLNDWFRLEGERFIKTSTPNIPDALRLGLAEHVAPAVHALNHKLGLKPKDYAHAVFQQPYGFVPYMLGGLLELEPKQVALGAVAQQIGDCGAASALLGLANVLDQAKPGDLLLLASYGFGAGSDAFALEVTDLISARRGVGHTVQQLLSHKELVDYAAATKFEHKFLKPLYPSGPWT